VRHFTPEEANAALEQVRPLVERMVEQRREHLDALERQEELEQRIRGNGGGIPPATLADTAAKVDRIARSLAQTVDEINAHGAEVKDRPVSVRDFMATVCALLGIDPAKKIETPVGRPIQIVDKGGAPIKEVVA
jgi:hypothetical protein